MAANYEPNVTRITVGDGIPADTNYLSPPSDGQQYIDQVTGRLYTRLKGFWLDVMATPGGLGTASAVASVSESISRASATFADLTVATTGQLYYVQLPLLVGHLVSNLTFRSGETAANTPTHYWACLLDSTRAIQAISADKTNTAWAADTDVTFAMGTPFRVATAGPWYAGLMMAATGVVTLDGVVDYDADNATDPPILCGVGTPTSVTGPPALLVVQGAITASANKAWVGVS